MFDGHSTVTDPPFCRNLWTLECLIERELNSRLCVAVMFIGANLFFVVVRFFCRSQSRSFFLVVGTTCEVLLWLGPWSRMTRNLSVDECVSTVDSAILTQCGPSRYFPRIDTC